MSGYIGINNIARKVTSAYIGVNGVARKVKKIYVGDANGIARLVYGASAKITYTFVFSSSQTIRMIMRTGETINWGDGTSETVSSNTTLSHSCTAGNYTVEITNITATYTADRISNGYWYVTSIVYENGTLSRVPASYASYMTMTSITFPTTGISGYVAYQCFQYCDVLPSIYIPDGVTYTTREAFSSCALLSSLSLPSTITQIAVNGNYFLSSCPQLTTITFRGTKAQWNAITKPSTWADYTNINKVSCTDGDITVTHE